MPLTGCGFWKDAALGNNGFPSFAKAELSNVSWPAATSDNEKGNGIRLTGNGYQQINKARREMAANTIWWTNPVSKVVWPT